MEIGTTGARFFDFVIADNIIAPSLSEATPEDIVVTRNLPPFCHQSKFFTETIICMPHSYQVF